MLVRREHFNFINIGSLSYHGMVQSFVDPELQAKTMRDVLRIFMWALLLIMTVLLPEIVLHP